MLYEKRRSYVRNDSDYDLIRKEKLNTRLFELG